MSLHMGLVRAHGSREVCTGPDYCLAQGRWACSLVLLTAACEPAAGPVWGEGRNLLCPSPEGVQIMKGKAVNLRANLSWHFLASLLPVRLCFILRLISVAVMWLSACTPLASSPLTHLPSAFDAHANVVNAANLLRSTSQKYLKSDPSKCSVFTYRWP